MFAVNEVNCVTRTQSKFIIILVFNMYLPTHIWIQSILLETTGEQ